MPTKKQLLEENKRLRSAARTKREPDMSHFGGVLQEAREQKGMGVQDLSRASGVSAGLITRAEVKGSIEMKTLFRLAFGLKVPASTLVHSWEIAKP